MTSKTFGALQTKKVPKFFASHNFVSTVRFILAPLPSFKIVRRRRLSRTDSSNNNQDLAHLQFFQVVLGLPTRNSSSIAENLNDSIINLASKFFIISEREWKLDQ